MFLASILPMLLYTRGYRIDFEALKLVETGGIDLNIITADTKVYLDDELKTETSFVFKNAVFRNILPGNYDAVIEKTGYKSWYKKIPVMAGQVNKFLDIRLFPEEMMPTIVAEHVQEVFPSPDLKFALVQSESNISEGTVAQKGIQLLLSDNNRETIRPILALASGESIKEILWSWNSDIFFIFGQSATGDFAYSGSVRNPQELTSWSSFLKNNFPAAYLEANIRIPANSTETLYIMRRNADSTFSFNKINLGERTITTDILKDIMAYQINNNDIFYISKEGVIYSANIENGESTQLSPTAISRVSADSKLIVRDDKLAVIVINRGELFLWETEKPLIKVGQNVLGAVFSPDREKFLYWGNEQVNIYWAEEVFGPPLRAIGDKEVISGYSPIKNVGWTGDSASYVVLQIPDKIVFAELDSRDRRNIAEYRVQASSKIFGVDRSVRKILTVIDGNMVYLHYN